MGFRIAILVVAVLAGLAGGYAGMALAQPVTGSTAAAHAGPGESARDGLLVRDGHP